MAGSGLCRWAAQQGDAEAQCRLGRYLAAGFGVRKDAAEAAVWYRNAADRASLRRSTAWLNAMKRVRAYQRIWMRQSDGIVRQQNKETRMQRNGWKSWNSK